MKIDDRRMDKRAPGLGYVVATDAFMSGWGMAPGRSLFAVPVDSSEEASAVLTAMRLRSEMKRPRVVTRKRADGTPLVRLRGGDHLSVQDREDAAEFYRGAAARWGNTEAA